MFPRENIFRFFLTGVNYFSRSKMIKMTSLTYFQNRYPVRSYSVKGGKQLYNIPPCLNVLRPIAKHRDGIYTPSFLLIGDIYPTSADAIYFRA